MEHTLEHLENTYNAPSQLTLIFPNKRAGSVFKNKLRLAATKPSFFPIIYSAETFIEEVATLTVLNPAQLLLKSYRVYLNTSAIEEKEPFESFVTWAPTLLNDLNEMDGHLVPPEQFFAYLTSIQDIKHWSLQKEQTAFVKNYLKFWNALPQFYKNLNETLATERSGYQGQVYRKAAQNVPKYVEGTSRPHIFIGFNALNAAEQAIFKAFLKAGKGEAIWDVDSYFMARGAHSATHFQKKYFAWQCYKEKQPKLLSNSYAGPKNIQLLSAQKAISQVKY
ncbi:MAG: PD-(D/E)XK nuclease family protein, partial [Marinirhabdus sp.]